MGWNESGRASARPININVSEAELDYLRPGLSQSGGKLPLFDVTGQRINPQTMRSCIQKGLCEPWFANPMKPDWLVCRLTQSGHEALIKYNGR